MFGFLRKRTEAKQREAVAFQFGQKTGATMTAAVDSYLNVRLPSLTANLLDVLQQRLLTINDDSQHDPKLVAYAELKVFLENVEDFDSRVLDEVRQSQRDWFGLAAQAGSKEMLEMYARQKVEAAKLELMEQGKLMALAAVKGSEG
jgi:hypothetical protein